MSLAPFFRAVLLLGILVPGAFAQDEPLTAGSGGVGVPKRTKTVAPEYPAEAQSQGIRGIVILELVIDRAGKVADARIIRSVPGLDEAALTAARQWSYEVTKVDGKPVSVRLTVPITFAMKLPEMTRQEGIPELRQGVAPPFPQDAKGPATVVVQVSLDGEGRVGEAQVAQGEAPWTNALMAALRTWRFAAETADVTVSFRVQADFIPPENKGAGKVSLRLDGLRRSESLSGSSAPAGGSGPAMAPVPPAVPPTAAAAPASGQPAATPAGPVPPVTAPPATAPATAPPAAAPPATAPPATVPRATAPPATAPPAAAPPAPSSPAAATPPPTATSPAPARPAPPATAPPSTGAAPAPGAPDGTAAPGPKPTATAADRPPTPSAATPSAKSAAPPVEVISAPPPPPTPVVPESGTSALRDVVLEAGVPDLTRGRRPVAPPFARMSATTGYVEVQFSVSAGGTCQVQSATGPDILKPAAEQTVISWQFRRTQAQRLFLTALFKYDGDKASALVHPQEPGAAQP